MTSQPNAQLTNRLPRGTRDLASMLAALALLAAACGSTITPGQGAESGDQFATEPGMSDEEAALSLDSSPGFDVATDGTERPGDSEFAAVPGTTTERGSGTTTAGGGTDSSGGSSTGGGGAAPTGAIPVGFLYTDDAEGTMAAFGADASRGDERAQYEALIEDLNARGGINGRTVEPTFYQTPSTTADREGDLQAACAHFTQDHDVFIVVSSRSDGTNESFKRCLEQSGVAHIHTNSSFAGEATYRANAHYVEPTNFSLDRSAANLVPSLAGQSYFAAWDAGTGQPATLEAAARVGIVAWDTPTHDAAVDGVLVPALERMDVEVAEIARINRTGEGAAGAGTASQEIGSAILRFRSSGVTHVTFLAGGGIPPALFMNQASGQNYRPRYGFTSQDLPSILLELGVITDPDGQLEGAVGMGWWPSADLPVGQNPFAERPQHRRCLDVLAEDGHNPQTAHAVTVAFYHCDNVDFLETTLTAAGLPLSLAAFRTGLDRVGESFEPRFTIATRVSAQRRDGAAATNDWQYRLDCSCFVYIGQPREAR